MQQIHTIMTKNKLKNDRNTRASSFYSQYMTSLNSVVSPVLLDINTSTVNSIFRNDDIFVVVVHSFLLFLPFLF